jgi:hypothetical protein
MFWILLLLVALIFGLKGRNRRRAIAASIVYLVVVAVATVIITSYFPMLINW